MSVAALGQVIVIAIWLGAAAFVAAVVAPAAFDALPTRELAGALVGRLLPALFVTGTVAAIAALWLDVAAGRRRFRPGRIASMCAIILACGVAQLGVAPRIASLRAGLSGPLASLSADDPQRIAFGRLHMWSVGWLALAMLAGGVAIVLGAVTLRPSDSQ